MSFRQHPLFKIVTRPVVALAIMIGLFMVLFPNWGPRELTAYVRLPTEACASEITIAAWEGEVLARSTMREIRDERDMTTTFSLPRAEYRLVVELACPNGAVTRVHEENVDLHEHADLSFDLSRKCPCAEK